MAITASAPPMVLKGVVKSYGTAANAPLILGGIDLTVADNEIIAILGVEPGPVIGRAYKFLLELRMEQGPLEKEQAEAALKAWWADHQA